MNPKALNLAGRLAKTNPDEGYKIITKLLQDDPNHCQGLITLAYILISSGRTIEGYHVAKRATELGPGLSTGWLNFGMACQDLWRHDEARRAYERGLTCADEDDKVLLLNNLCALSVDRGRFAEGKRYAEAALEVRPDHQKSLANLGFCQLGTREWNPGWKNYRHCLDTDWRHKIVYGDEPEWDGSPGKTVVAYGEQGLGDEISFASMIPDAQKDCKRLIIDCDERLAGLFKRSFPGVSVYGTRRAKELRWAKEDQQIDASTPMGQLGEFYRLTDESFPGTPYLTPDPERVLMWKSLFESKGKPVIGIAWRGGIPKTGAKFRQWTLEELLPIFHSVDAHWVCLQYKPAQAEIARFRKDHPEVDLKEYPQATLTPDYDDTAGIVAALDMVVCMQTAVGHLAGALGVPAWVFVPQNSQWRYGSSGDSIPWYNSLKVIRQARYGQWDDDIKRVARDLKRRYAGVKVANQ